jgi:hypothetical protein
MPQQASHDVAGPSDDTLPYDSAVIVEMARRLLARAQSLVLLYTLFGLLLGLIPLVSVSWLQEHRGLGVVGMLLLMAVGYAIGNQRGFSLKLQAQLLLCQVSIERNTASLVKAWARSQ